MSATIIVKPGTVLRWHCSGFQAFWHWKPQSHGGRPKIFADVHNLIR
jgi:hypothetical protein